MIERVAHAAAAVAEAGHGAAEAAHGDAPGQVVAHRAAQPAQLARGVDEAVQIAAGQLARAPVGDLAGGHQQRFDLVIHLVEHRLGL